MWFDIQLIYSINESRKLGSLELGFRCSLEYNNQCFGLVPQNASSLLITSQETVGFFSPSPLFSKVLSSPASMSFWPEYKSPDTGCV